MGAYGFWIIGGASAQDRLRRELRPQHVSRPRQIRSSPFHYLLLTVHACTFHSKEDLEGRLRMREGPRRDSSP